MYWIYSSGTHRVVLPLGGGGGRSDPVSFSIVIETQNRSFKLSPDSPKELQTIGSNSLKL